jgi:hypothetical protein
MSLQRIIGLALLILGIVLFFTGLHSSHSLVDRAHDVLYGNYTANTTMCLYGGVAVGIAGLLLLVLKRRKP